MDWEGEWEVEEEGVGEGGGGGWQSKLLEIDWRSYYSQRNPNHAWEILYKHYTCIQILDILYPEVTLKNV